MLPAQLPRTVRIALLEYRPLYFVIDDTFIRAAHKPQYLQYLLPKNMMRGIEIGRARNIAKLLDMADIGDMLEET